ncbi:MAG: class I SAM-dependent methyltransferase [Anaerolineae bacterium]|nr:class I SAM-dependent methyltransferase [Anaerolineae bacterium]MBN8620212.1 class I SAM-dependent methyltransferase [Anaerolineae bacterium]
MTHQTDPDYQQKLAAEARLWGDEARKMAQHIPPDWAHHRHLRHNVIMHAADIDALLACIQPGMKTLELGCASGWLTLAMAERGADATGLDLSDESLQVARDYYHTVRDQISGQVTYQAVDLNYLDLPASTYDVIVVKASLHHLVRLDHVIRNVHQALKPGGLFWAADTAGDEHILSVLIAGAICFVLPTETAYADKMRALLRFGFRAPSRVKASIQADGLSPFEGAGRDHDWVSLISQQFRVEKRVDMPAFTGYVTAQFKAPDAVAVPILKVMRVVDSALVRAGLLKNTGVILYARR